MGKGQAKGFRHTEETKRIIGEHAKESQARNKALGRGGFNAKINCPNCGQTMSPANLGKHLPACQERGKLEHLFQSGVTIRQIKSWRTNLRESYGMTVADYLKLHDEQGGACAICGGRNRNKPLFVDHCHISGKVRGLLCDLCNVMVGAAHDEPTVLTNAARYLQEREVVIREIPTRTNSPADAASIHSAFVG